MMKLLKKLVFKNCEDITHIFHWIQNEDWVNSGNRKYMLEMVKQIEDLKMELREFKLLLHKEGLINQS